MLQFNSEEVADRNETEFNRMLKSIPNWTGIKHVMIRGNETFYFDQVNNVDRDDYWRRNRR